MARTVAVAIQKGGSGKTTTALNLGAALVERGRSVLLVDCDPQANATVGAGFNPADVHASLADVLAGTCTLADTLLTSDFGVTLAPSAIDLATTELALFSACGRRMKLREVLAPLTEKFDWVLLDCPPSLGVLTLNALVAAREVLIPVAVGYYAYTGMERLLDLLDQVRESLNPDLRVLGILPNLVERTTLSQQVLHLLRDRYGDLVFHTEIRKAARLGETSLLGQPIIRVATHSEAARAFRALAEEVEERE